VSGGHYTKVMHGVVSFSIWWCLSFRQRWRDALAAQTHYILDVWLMVVMCAWLFDIHVPRS